MNGKPGPILSIENLTVEFPERDQPVVVLRGVTLDVARGETLAIVGESGCGKSMTARSILGIIPEPGRLVGGSITFHPQAEAQPIRVDTLPVDGVEIREIRGKKIAMIFQEPMTSFSPVHTIGKQIIEAIQLHTAADRVAARARAIEALDMVGIPNPSRVIDDYPFQLSGGMRQRAMIAMAISCEPELLVADEPTTAVDVTVQAQIIGLLKRLQAKLGMSVIIITHNLGVVAAMAERVAVMYMGRIVEEARTDEIFSNPAHPYTKGLLNSIPVLGRAERKRLTSIPGAVPDMRIKIPGCPFSPRCPDVISGVCDVDMPDVFRVNPDHTVRCVLYSGTTQGNEVQSDVANGKVTGDRSQQQ